MNILERAKLKGYTIDKNGIVTGLNKNTLVLFIIKATDSGYYNFNYRHNKKKVNVPAHRFQAYMKFGDKMFKKGIVVRHLDGNSRNNSFVNIAIGTNSDNMMDKSREQRRKGASHPKYDHLEILKDRDDGMTYKEIMEKHGIKSKGTVNHIIKHSLAQE